MEDIAFKEATEANLSDVVRILNDALRYKKDQGDQAWGDDEWHADEVRETLKNSVIYLMYLGNKAVGTVSLQWEDHQNWGPQPPIAGYLHKLAIAEGCHGKDFGAKLIDWSQTQVAKKDRKFLRLDCEASNKSLCAYYVAKGFTQTAVKNIPRNGRDDYVAALFEKPIPALKKIPR